jgi:nucleotide-binding universal stress UspA family protein
MTLRPRTIMVGYDGSDGATRALTAAADLVGYGSTLAVVMVHAGAIDRSTADGAREQLQRRHVEARYHDLRGEAAEQLVEKAHELAADLMVVGRRGRKPLPVLPGSVSARVVRRAPCDVLLVR